MKGHFSNRLAEYAGKTLYTEAEQRLVAYLEYAENMFRQKVTEVENLLGMTDRLPEMGGIRLGDCVVQHAQKRLN